MTLMQPDPSAEFRREKEYRAKVYNLLSMGLSTTEIENILQKHVDWSQFSLETLDSFVESKKPILTVEFPQAFRNAIFASVKAFEDNSDSTNSKIQSIEDKLKSLESNLINVAYLLIACAFIGILIFIGLLIR